MKLPSVVGFKVFNGKHVVHRFPVFGNFGQLLLGEITLPNVSVFTCTAGVNLADITISCASVGFKKVDVVRVDASIYNACYHSFTRVGLWQANALVYFVYANGFSNEVHFLCNRTRELYSAYAFQFGDAFNAI